MKNFYGHIPNFQFRSMFVSFKLSFISYQVVNFFQIFKQDTHPVSGNDLFVCKCLSLEKIQTCAAHRKCLPASLMTRFRIRGQSSGNLTSLVVCLNSWSCASTNACVRQPMVVCVKHKSRASTTKLRETFLLYE